MSSKKSKTIKELRTALAQLGAKQTGNKEALQRRLDNWQQNGLSSTLISVSPVPAVDTTSFESPRKFEAIEKMDKTAWDWFTYTIIEQYFSVRQALKSFREGRKLHIANHLRQIGFAKTTLGNIQIRSLCKAGMKKNVVYSIVLELSPRQISKATCSCPAGQGNSAACKHVAALLVCMECYLVTGMIVTGASCTSELQMWHKPPKLQHEDQTGLTINELFTGSPSTRAEPVEAFTRFAVDTSLNYGLNTSFNKIRNCNLVAYHHDHDYCSNGFKEYVDNLNHISPDDIKCIEQDTIQQSSNENWFEHRKSRLTASNIHAIITAMETSYRDGKPPSTVPAKKNFEKLSLNIPALAWGKEKEDCAFQIFCAAYPQYEFKKCGLFIDKNRNFLAGSPDGISTCGRFVLEIKSPYSIRSESPSRATCWDNNGKLRKKHPYYSQVQYQMYVTQARSCFYIVYTLKGIKVSRIDYDESFMLSTLKLVDQYYEHVFCEQYCIKFGIRT